MLCAVKAYVSMVCHRDVNACLNIMYVFIYEWINGSPWRLHQGISAAAASRLGARAVRGVRALRASTRAWRRRRIGALVTFLGLRIRSSHIQ